MDMTPPLQPLQREVEDLLQFLYLMPVSVVRLGESGEVLMLNPKAVQLLEGLGVDAGRADGTAILDALSPGASAQWLASAGQVGTTLAPRLCSPPIRGGKPQHLHLHVVRPDERCSMFVVEDVTQTVEQERELARQRRRMALALEQIEGYAVLMLDTDGAVIEWNPSIGRLFGKPAGQGAGEPLFDWIDHGRATNALPAFSQVCAAVQSQGCAQWLLPWRHESGQLLWGDTVVTPLVESDSGIGGYVAVVRDVTEDQLRRQQLISAAMHDPLTGVRNRRGLEQQALQLPEPDPATAARAGWVMIDIDHFKKVNDRHGHEGGDNVLKAVAGALQAATRGGDVLARFGGEEFVLLLPACSEALALSVAERLRQRVQALRVDTASGPVGVTASFGVAMQAPGESWTRALERADAALYRAKEGGRNQVQRADAPGAAAAGSKIGS
jgi:diguanylate cyclase (GGDEF)-like protein/PAS domain S-box-containing protein